MKMKEFFKKNWLFISALAILNIVFVRFNILSLVANTASKKVGLKGLALLAICLAINFVALVVYAFVKKKSFSREKTYLVIAGLLGFICIFATPIDYIPDEYRHIMRAYEISKGNFIADWNEDDKAMMQMPISIDNARKNKLNPKGRGYNAYRTAVGNIIHATDGTIEKDYSTTAGYHPIVYLPHSTGMFVNNMLGFPPLLGVYLGRIFELICVLAMCYFALKILPKYKDVFTLFLLFPLTLQQSMGVTADGLLIGASFLFVAIAIRLIYDNKFKLSAKWLTLLYALATVIVVCKKIVYFPLLLVLFLIPQDRFKSKKMKYIHIGGIMLLSLAFTGVWMLTQETTVSTGTSGLSGVLKNPIDFIVRMFGTFFGSHTVEYYDQLVGHKIDYNEISCNAWFYVFATFAMIVALMIRNTETIKIKKIDRLLYALIPTAVICLIYFVAETQWQDFAGQARVYGFNGRYLIPLLIFVPFIAHSSKVGRPKRINMDIVYILMIGFNACVLTVKVLNNIL